MRPFNSAASEEGVETLLLDASFAANLKELGYDG